MSKSPMKSRPPKKQENINAFVEGAGQSGNENSASQEIIYPWEMAGVREDIAKVFNLRLPEPYFLKLKYISENILDSMQGFCLKVLKEEIDKQINEII